MEWMAWTPEVAIFFVCVVLMLIAMTVWELRSPTVERKGWLPIPTTRGDRLFIGLLTAAYINLGWVALTDADALSPWIGFAISMAMVVAVMKKG